MIPRKSILDRSVRYVDAAHTNIAATFRRIRREYEKSWDEAHAENEQRNQVTARVVRPMKKGSAS